MSENRRGPEVPEEKVPVVECLGGLARITLEELAITHFVKNGTLQNACSTRPRVVVGCSFAHRQVDEQNSERSKKNDDKSAVAMLKKRKLARERICLRKWSKSNNDKKCRGFIEKG